MPERVRVSSKMAEARRENKASQTRKADISQTANSPVDRILFLQRTIGNQAVQRLINSGTLQTKLRIGKPDNIYEQEADRITEQVMRMPEPQVVKSSVVSSQKLSTRIQRRCPRCTGNLPKRKEEEELIHAKEVAGNVPEVTSELETQISALRGGGQPLPASVQAYFEARFGYDFSKVRVHIDALGDALANAVNARAFTVGQDMVFGAGRYQPHTYEGRRLIAHELTHVVQQEGGHKVKVQGIQAVGLENCASEQEVIPLDIPATTPVLQRQPKPTAPTPALPGSPSCTPRTGITEYGCYCGAGSSCPALNCTPANALDACCKQHDIDYAGCSFLDRYNPFSRCYAITRVADARLCACARGLSGRFHGASEAYRLGVIGIFC